MCCSWWGMEGFICCLASTYVPRYLGSFKTITLLEGGGYPRLSSLGSTTQARSRGPHVRKSVIRAYLSNDFGGSKSSGVPNLVMPGDIGNT